MNNAEAKFILQGYRPNGADAGDATFCAAVEQSKTDPALGDWFSRQQAFDAAVSAKLAQIQPPADLRAAILAGGTVSASKVASRSKWARPAWMAMAAGLAVLLAVGVALWPRQALALNEFAFEDARLGAMHGHGDRGAATNALQWTLSQPSTKLGHRLPVDFAALRSSGCRVVRYHDRDLLEVCFNRNGVWFHCYIAKAADFPQLALGKEPVFEDKSGASLVSWQDAEQIVVVVCRTGRKNLEALL